MYIIRGHRIHKGLTIGGLITVLPNNWKNNNIVNESIEFNCKDISYLHVAAVDYYRNILYIEDASVRCDCKNSSWI